MKRIMDSCFTWVKPKSRVTYPDSSTINRRNMNRAGGNSERQQVLLRNPKDELYYNISNGKSKKVIIFNCKQYEEDLSPDIKTRTETDADCDKLIQRFSALGFTPEKYDDPSYEEIKEVIEEASQLKSTEVNCVVIIVMTYGFNNVLFWKYGMYSTDDILKPFVDSQSLAGVPKLFFIQAHPARPSLEADGEQVCVIPKYADILWVYSSIKDKVSLEKEDGHNVFIQTLCDHLDEETCKTYNILQILAMVNKRLLRFPRSNNSTTTEEMSDYVAVDLPHYKSTLTKLLQLNYLHGTVEMS